MNPAPQGYARTVIYDDDCGFCLRSIRIGKWLDWRRCMDWYPRSEPGLYEKFPKTNKEETLNRMVSIRPDGKVYGGFFAVRDILLHCPLTFIPAFLLYIPGVSLAGDPAYRWVAKNRHRFGGGAGSCAIKR